MSKSGVGRGRGWLNLNKTQSQNAVPKVGAATAGQDLTAAEESRYIDASSSYNDLINKIQQLNIKDDGILFNQKIKYVLENWKQDCQNSEQVEKSFDRIYESCLSDPELGTKLVMMIASRSFITQEVHDQNIRLMFLTRLQNSFEDAKQLQKTNPVIFRNSVHLLGEFYNKARLANGQQLQFMATPLLTNLRMLLDTAQLDDLKLFTTQLYLNGASLKTECPEVLSEVLNNVRLALIGDKVALKESRLWLLLALDVANNRFGLQPAEIQKFYQEQLGDGAMADFQVWLVNNETILMDQISRVIHS
ncbi:unnamed protein product [Acanthoscelides obtectus]|uniref:Uncharacterized protein n=1 Tax=Acanthoscelides obtectus TaxID=200917 RepID=A0A9P0M8E3_ACAOB|nr:unnamed protein product [Acanthoscelides obtectus]CAK1676066.1 hypothetical protein AOBTE_LOCUS30573 [Acanthoscelides obtectus]